MTISDEDTTIVLASQALTIRHHPDCPEEPKVNTFLHGKTLVLVARCSRCGTLPIIRHSNA